MKKLTILLISFLSWNCVFAQYNSKIDSLKNVLSKSKNEDTSKVNILNSLSLNLQDIAEYEMAKQYANEALAISKKNKYKTGMARSYRNIANIFVYQGDYTAALKYNLFALKIVEELGNKKGVAAHLGNIGTIYYMQSNFPRALENQFKAMKINEEIGNKYGIGVNLTNIGMVYGQQEDYPKAIDHYLKALKIFEEIGREEGIATNLGYIGIIYDKQGDYPKALDFFFKALKIDEKFGYKQGIAFDLRGIGIIFSKQGNYTKALDYYSRALKIDEEIGNKDGIAVGLGNIGMLYTKTGKFKEAEEKLIKAIALTESLGSKNLLQSYEQGLSDLYDTTARYKLALLHYKKAMILKNTLFNQEKDKKITQMAMQYDFDKKEAIAKKEVEKKELIQASLLADTKKNRNVIIGILVFTMIFSGSAFYSVSQRKKLRLQKQVNEVEMKALRAQMNPHFMFNALNSIYSYIKMNEMNAASEFVMKFSKLMRLTLENSMQPYISIEEELEALELYMSLESTRLNNKFCYSVNVTEDIDQSSILIPPMLLQPYIENSIWHGMENKEAGGLIDIQIEKENEMLLCTISDNGPGFGEKKNSKSHKSYGSSLSAQRIEILNRLKKANGYVKISQPTQSTGVKVELAIPILE